MGLPFLGFMATMHIAALFGAWVAVGTAVVVLGLISWFLWNHFRTYLKKKEEEKGKLTTGASVKSLLVKYVVSFNVSAAASLASLLCLYTLVRIEDDRAAAVPMIAICTVIVTLTNFFVAVQYRGRPGRALLTVILATLVLLACGETVSGGKDAVSTRLMEKFGVGGVAEHTLVITANERQVLEQLKVLPPSSAPGSVGVVEHVRILSRLGKEYFVEVNHRRIAIPRDQLLSWTVEPKVAQGETHPTAAPRTTHHFLLAKDGGAIQVEANDPADTESVTEIRTHLAEVAQAFSRGDFGMPGKIHSRVLPGIPEMTRLKDAISYRYGETDRGAQVRITTGDPEALEAVHTFLRAQIEDHRTGIL